MKITDKDRLDFIFEHCRHESDVFMNFEQYIDEGTNCPTVILYLYTENEDGEDEVLKFLGVTFEEAIDKAIMAMRGKDE